MSRLLLARRRFAVDLKLRQGSLKRGNASVCDLGVVQVEEFQLAEPLQVNQSRIGHPRLFQSQSAERIQVLQMGESRIADGSASQMQRLETAELAKFGQPRVGDTRPSQPQAPKFRQTFDLGYAPVSDPGVSDVQYLQLAQTRQELQPSIGDLRTVEPHVDDFRESGHRFQVVVPRVKQNRRDGHDDLDGRQPLLGGPLRQISGGEWPSVVSQARGLELRDGMLLNGKTAEVFMFQGD